MITPTIIINPQPPAAPPGSNNKSLPPSLPIPLTLIVVITSLISILIHKRIPKNSIIPDNLVTLIIGLIVGSSILLLLFQSSSTKEQEDSSGKKSSSHEWILANSNDEQLPQLFFDFCLPPIVFAAALNEGHVTSWSGVIFALSSTIFTALTLGQVLDYFFGHDITTAGLLTTSTNTVGKISYWNCFTKGCLFWSTILTPVNSRLSIRKAEQGLDHDDDEVSLLLPAKFQLERLLHSESLLSGTFAVVLFGTEMNAKLHGDNVLYPIDVIKTFLEIGIGSTLWGLLVAFISTSTLTFEDYHPKEVVLFVFWSLLGFFGARLLNLNSVATLFTCGIVMSKTSLLAMSERGVVIIKDGINTIANTSETFIFSFLGICCSSFFLSTIDSSDGLHASAIIIISTLFIRVIIATITSFIGVWIGPRIGINLPEFFYTLRIVSLSSIRGVVSFALALAMGDEHADLIAMSAVLVIFSHVILSPLLTLMLRENDLKDEGDEHVSGVLASENSSAQNVRRKNYEGRLWPPSPKIIRGHQPNQPNQQRNYNNPINITTTTTSYGALNQQL
jgi:hypothetical protein